MIAAGVDEAIESPPLLFGDAASRQDLALLAETYVARAQVMMTRARLLVDAGRSDCLELLTARRLALRAHLHRYQRFKHGSIFDPVVRYGLPSSKVVAQAMKVDCLTLGEAFAAYHTRCLRLRAPEWQRYRADMLSTVDSLSTHLDGELRAMRQLIMISDFYHEKPPTSPGG